MKPFVLILSLVFSGLLVVSLSNQALAIDFQSKYAVITYFDINDLREFNDELYMGRLSSQMRKGGDTLEDEVIAKIDLIVEKVMSVLDMFPRPLKFYIQIHPGEREVQQEFRRLYNVDVDYIAFYSPSKNMIFYSADNGRLRVVTHEIGHVVAENYFTVSPPQRIHELMAQFAEKHISD
ncbi:MAG: hypothetical protein ABIJ59_12070 [Pseudomonadota bacterium]